MNNERQYCGLIDKWFFLGVFATLIIFFCIVFNWGIIFGYGCYEDKGTLHNQKVGYLEGCCDDCLILNVTEFVCKGQPRDGCGCEYKDKTLYFANEKELLNISDGEEINIKWCWIKSIKDYRIRGVS